MTINMLCCSFLLKMAVDIFYFELCERVTRLESALADLSTFLCPRLRTVQDLEEILRERIIFLERRFGACLDIKTFNRFFDRVTREITDIEIRFAQIDYLADGGRVFGWHVWYR